MAKPMAKLKITTSRLPDALQGQSYSQQMHAAGGIQPYSWTCSALPPGMQLTSDGVLDGVPTTVGTYTITFTCKDSSP